MRSVIYIGVSVLILGISSAAAEEMTIIDNGADNANIINQLAAGTDSSIYVEQSGNGSFAGGFPENVFIDQNSTGADSTISVIQSGDNIGARLIQFGASTTADDIDVIQGGSDNTADVNQNGEGLIADVDQNGTLDATVIDQVGNNNSAEVYQSGIGNSGTITQNSFGNRGTINQQGTLGVVDLSQPGSDNTATITQNPTVAANSSVSVTQTGSFGYTTINQN